MEPLTKEQHALYDKITKIKATGKSVTQACKDVGVKPHVWSYVQWKMNRLKARDSKKNYAKIATGAVPVTTAPLSQMVLVRGTPEQIREFLGGSL